MNLFELFVKIGADTSQAEKGMKSTQGVSETLTNKIKVMSAQFEAAQKNVDKLSKEFNESVQKTGATSKETQELAKKLDDAEKEAEQAKKALEGYNKKLEDTGKTASKSGAELSSFAEKLGNGLKTASKIGVSAVASLGAVAIKTFADFEQLTGGIETIFGSAADQVKQYASEAYRSAGLSANEYMSTVTGFSASLLQSLGRGAQTDLDALKENLDEQYDATKKSWQDRIEIAKKLKQRNVAELEAQMDAELRALKKGNEQKLAEAETANNKSVVTAETQALAADLANQAVIDMADNAAKMGTSMEMIQNAYAGFAKQNYTMLDNLKLGYGGTQSEMQRLIKHAAELDSSIDANSLSFDNIVKAINVVQTEMGITGTTALEASGTISGSFASMKAAASDFATALIDENGDIDGSFNKLKETAFTFFDNLKPRIMAFLEAISPIATTVAGITGAFVAFKTAASISALLSKLIVSFRAYQKANEGATISQWLMNAAMNANPIVLVVTLIGGLVAAIVTLWNTNEGFRNALINAWNAIGSAAKSIFSAVANFFTETIPNAFNSVIDWFKDVGKKFANIGKNIVDGLKNGISNAWKNLKKWFTDLFGDLTSIAKKILGIASPSKVFKKIGLQTAQGYQIGFDDEFAKVKDDMEDALNFDDASVGINASIRKVGAGAAGGAFGGTSIGNITINIDGAKYSDEQSLASAIALEIQNMTDRRAAVYA